MKRNVLQVPIRIELREKAEKEAKDMGFSSLQEMVRVMLAQMVKKEIEPEFKIDDLCDKYGINYLGMFTIPITLLVLFLLFKSIVIVNQYERIS